MAEFIPDMNNCPMCMVKGPALIPARYAVVTDNITGGIPAWATPANAEPYKPVPGYSYALRAMRQGFIYVFYEFSQHWDAWAICEDGSLWKQPSGAYAQPKKTPDCSSPKHQATNLEMMILDEMALEGNTWLAFSPSKWMSETLERYASDADLRQKRMQCLESWQWTTPANSLGVTAASPGSLESILDYKDSGMTHPSRQLPYNPTIRRISQTEPKAPWYNFEEHDVKPQGTIYPWSQSRIGGAPRTMQALKNRHEGKNKYGKDTTPLVMAIEDPVGIAHELAGFGDDFAGLHKAWMDDLSIEFASDYWLNGVKNQLRELNRAQALHDVDYNMGIIAGMTQGHNSDEDIAQLRSKAHINAIKSGETEFAHDWEKYNGRLNQEKREAFHKCHASFCEQLAKQLETLAALRVQWLKDSHFILCSQDFYSTRVEDNLSYQEIVDYAMASLNLTDTGTEYLDGQIDAYAATDANNIVWRSWMLNNPEVIEETQPFMNVLSQSRGNPAKANKEAYLAAISTLSNKFVKAYAKANDIVAGNPSPTSSWSRAMLHTDRKLTTMGDRFFSYTRLGNGLDSMTEMLHKSLITVASGVPFNNAVALSVSQLEFGDVYRQEVLSNVSNDVSQNRVNNLNKYKVNFDKFAQSAEGEKVLKKARIKLLVLLFNILEYKNQAKKQADNPTDAKELSKYLSALASTINTTTSVVMPAIEHGIKNQTLTSSIKWTGAGAGSVASILTLSVDVSAGVSEIMGEQRWGYITLSAVKVGVDMKIAANALNELLVLLIERELIASGGILTTRIMAFATMESIAWIAGWEVMIGLYLIDQLLILYYGNELQIWCEKSVFGVKAEKELLSTEYIGLNEQRKNKIEKQKETLLSALKVIQ
ncbi:MULTISPECIES: T6SS effector BTH_I2691 family protein [Enterobacterales]|uniref:T6SS effector BTH_I2691 family protein n=1 Tax=Enterobacterales TaxID=91347 RepID=UPI002ED9402B